MFCPKRGHKNEEEARFCEECGALLAKAEPGMSPMSQDAEPGLRMKARILPGVRQAAERGRSCSACL